MHIRHPAARQVGLGRLGDHPAFEQRTRQRSGQGRCGIGLAGQHRHQSRIQEMQLGRLDDALAVVAEPGRQQTDDIGGFKHACPGLDRGLRDAQIARQLRRVEQLAMTRRHQLQEVTEGPQVGDVAQLPDVTLDVGGHVALEPEVAALGMQGGHWIAAVPQRALQRGTGPFGMRQRGQFQHGHPAGQRFADAPHQGELLRTGQPPTPAARRVGVDAHLQVRQQAGHMLDLVQDHGRLAESRKETHRVDGGEVPLQRIVEADIGHALARLLAQQRGLARLARAGQHDARKPRQGVAQGAGEATRDVHP